MLAKKVGGNRMTSLEHLSILKRGVKAWNRWRQEHPEIQPDLRGANLVHAHLRGANLSGANLFGANLTQAQLSFADLREAELSESNLSLTLLNQADFRGAILIRAIFSLANLHGANLSETDLSMANFNGTDLREVTMSHALMELTIFANIDLRAVKGLETVNTGPAEISISTIYRSHGDIPETFLRSAGVPDTMIEYAHSLARKPIDFHSCFISYSSHDEAFVKRLYADLQSNGIRCWFAPEDLKIGDKIRPRIDESSYLYDKLLLVLCQYSLASK